LKTALDAAAEENKRLVDEAERHAMEQLQAAAESTDQLEELRKGTEELRRSRDDLQSTADALRIENAELRAEVEAHGSATSEHGQALEEMKHAYDVSLGDKDARLAELERALEDKASRLTAAEREAENLRDEVKSVQEALKTLESSNQAIEEKLEARKRAYAELEKTANYWQVQVESTRKEAEAHAKEQRDASEQKVLSLSLQLQETEAALTAGKAELADMQTRLVAAEEECTRIRNDSDMRIEELREEVARSKAAADGLQISTAQASGAHEESLRNKDESIAELEGIIGENISVIAKKELAEKSLKAQVEQLQMAIEETESERCALLAKLKEQEASRAELETEKAMLQTQLAGAEQRREEAATSLESAIREKETLANQLAESSAADADVRDLQHRLQQLSAEMSGLQQKCSSLSGENQQYSKQNGEMSAMLAREREDTQRKLEAAEASRTAYEKRLKEQDQQLQASKSRLHQAESQLQHMRKGLSERDVEAEQVRTSLTEQYQKKCEEVDELESRARQQEETLTEEIHELRKTLQDQASGQERLRDIQRELDAAVTQKKSLESENLNLREDVARKSEEMHARALQLEALIKASEGDLRAAQERASVSEEKASREALALESALEEHQSTLSKLADVHRETLEAAVREATERAEANTRSDLEQRVSELTSAEAGARRRLEAVDARCEGLERDLAEARATVRAREIELETERTASLKAGGSSATNDRFREEVEEARRLVDELTSEKSVLHETAGALQEELSVLQRENKELRRSLAAKEQLLSAPRALAANGRSSQIGDSPIQYRDSPSRVSYAKIHVRQLQETLEEERKILTSLTREHEDLLMLLTQQELEKAALKDGLLAAGGRTAVDAAMHTAATTAMRRFGVFVDESGVRQGPPPAMRTTPLRHRASAETPPRPGFRRSPLANGSQRINQDG